MQDRPGAEDASHHLEHTLFAGRYRAEALIGRGGMGTVYRALDEVQGGRVAIKVLRSQHGSVRRFEREATVLAGLNHSAVVRYIAHGRTEQDEDFLVMEWVEGSSLATLIAKGPLPVTTAVELGLRIADGLGYLHEEGIVHRDIKPENVILVGGDPTQLKLVDFGVVRESGSLSNLTQTGSMIGTVGYMAPEQLQGLKTVDQRADLFALGCILYECLTGAPPFGATNPVVYAAKVLLDEALPVTTVRKDVPAALGRLVDQLIAKAPADRPKGATAVVQALAAIDLTSTPSAPREGDADATLRSAERRTTTVLFVGPPIEERSAHDTAATREDTDAVVLDVVRAHVPDSAEVTRLGASATIVTFHSDSGPLERATEAARAALAFRARLRDRPIVLTTGRAMTTTRAAVGLALDQGGALLDQAMRLPSGGILVDELTATLIGAHFALTPVANAWRLEREISSAEVPMVRRQLLGHTIPCVGRRKELRLLEATLDEVEEDSIPSVALVTGPAGIGKTRLAIELLSQLKSRKVKTLVARATAGTSDSAGALLRALLRSASGLAEHSEGSNAWATLLRYVEALGLADARRSAEILGEWIGVPSPDAPSIALRAAREDAKVLRHWLGLITPAWLAAESQRQPIVLVLEDLHWADVASIRLLDEALACGGASKQGTHAGRLPVMVVALARPEVHERFEPLFRSVPVQELLLHGLSRNAAMEVILAALPDCAPATADRLLDLAQGNAFFLEELIRSVAAGQDELPQTLLMLTEAHLERTDPEARRLLRAGSIFGTSFEAAGVARVVGDSVGVRTQALLDTLVVAEILERRPGTLARGLVRYAFRHVLLRDAAYAMLPEAERPGAHSRAATWLTEQGSADPGVLAHHWGEANEPDKAAACYAQAASLALGHGDLEGADRLARRGLDLDPAGEARGVLLLVRGMVSIWQNDDEAGKQLLLECVPLLAPRSEPRASAIAMLAYQAARTSNAALVREALGLFGNPSDIAASGPNAQALLFLAAALLSAAGMQAAAPYVEALAAMDRAVGDEHGLVRGWHGLLAELLVDLSDDPADLVRAIAIGQAAFVAAGDPLGIAFSSAVDAYTSALLGRDDRAHAMLALTRGYEAIGFIAGYAHLVDAIMLSRTDPRAAMERLTGLREHPSLQARTQAIVLHAELALQLRDFDEVRAIARVWTTRSVATVASAADVVLGLVALEEGDLAAAQRHLEASRETAVHCTWSRLMLDRLRIGIYRAAGEADRERAAAQEALERLERMVRDLPDEERSRFWAHGFGIAVSANLIDSVLGPR